MSIFSENAQPAEDSSASECSTNPGAPTVEQIDPGDGDPGSVGKPRRERPKVHVVVRDEVTGETTILPSNPLSSVVMTTLQTNRDALVSAALAAVQRYDDLEEEAAGAMDAQGQEAVRRMLLVRESFEVNGEFDWAAFNLYADRMRGRLKKPPKNKWQRIARVSCPMTTKRPQVTKFGYILAALDRREITSADVMKEFAKREPVEEGGDPYGGMDRFVRLHKLDVKDEDGETKPKNPYERFTDERLAKYAKFLTEVLRSRKMLRDDIINVEGLLNDEAVVKLG